VDIRQSFPSKYLSAADLPDDGDLIVTITDVTMESVGLGAEASEKPVLYFQEAKKGLILNKTNTETICSLYGSETDDWEGKRLALFATEVDFKGKQTLAIRVRTRAPRATRPGAAAPQSPAPVPASSGDDIPF